MPAQSLPAPIPFPKAVLFDLDGTLLDSAPDMLAALNTMRGQHDLAPMLLAALRPHVSRGARAMLAAPFPHLPEPEREARVGPFLQCYERELGLHGGPFDGIEAMLAQLEA